MRKVLYRHRVCVAFFVSYTSKRCPLISEIRFEDVSVSVLHCTKLTRYKNWVILYLNI